MPHTILFKKDVAKRMGVSVATVDRHLALRRAGQGTFPLPISPFKAKGRWLASDIDAYIESLANANANTTAPVPSKRKQEQEYRRRQERAKSTLRQLGIDR